MNSEELELTLIMMEENELGTITDTTDEFTRHWEAGAITA